MFRSRMLFWFVALGSAAALVWVWLRRRSEAALPASPAPFATLDPPNGQMTFNPTATTPAVLSKPASQGGSAPAAGPRRIVTRVHRGAPPARSSAAPAEEAGAAPAAPAVLLTSSDPAPEPVAPDPTPAPAEPVAEVTAEPAAPVAEPAPAEPVAEVTAEPDAPVTEPETPAEPIAEVTAEPEIGEADEEPTADVGTVPVMPCNINSASLDELATLPGISRTVARRIIARRQEQGPFTTIEGLSSISGIGPQKLKDIAHLITVE